MGDCHKESERLSEAHGKGWNVVNLVLTEELHSHVQTNKQDYMNNSFPTTVRSMTVVPSKPSLSGVIPKDAIDDTKASGLLTLYLDCLLRSCALLSGCGDTPGP